MAKVYVGGVSDRATEAEIEQEFVRFGTLRSVWVARKPPGFAFVEFESIRDAEDAIRKLDGFNGWRVELSRTGAGRGGGRGGYGGGGGGGYRGGGGYGGDRDRGYGDRGGGMRSDMRGGSRDYRPSERDRGYSRRSRSPVRRSPRRSPSYSPRPRRSPSYGRSVSRSPVRSPRD